MCVHASFFRNLRVSHLIIFFILKIYIALVLRDLWDVIKSNAFLTLFMWLLVTRSWRLPHGGRRLNRILWILEPNLVTRSWRVWTHLVSKRISVLSSTMIRGGRETIIVLGKLKVAESLKLSLFRHFGVTPFFPIFFNSLNKVFYFPIQLPFHWIISFYLFWLFGRS